MKITKAQLKQLIKEAMEPIAGQDIPNEDRYPQIIDEFKEVLNSHFGDNYNFYQEIHTIAEYFAKGVTRETNI